jgi:hypothetical protein
MFCNYGRILICELFPYIVTHVKDFSQRYAAEPINPSAETATIQSYLSSIASSAAQGFAQIKSAARTQGENALAGLLIKAFQTAFCQTKQEVTVSGATVNVKYQSWAVAMGSAEWDAYFSRLGGAWQNVKDYPQFKDQVGALRDLFFMVFGAKLY